jgi:hypothetical protein
MTLYQELSLTYRYTEGFFFFAEGSGPGIVVVSYRSSKILRVRVDVWIKTSCSPTYLDDEGRSEENREEEIWTGTDADIQVCVLEQERK